MFIYALKSMCVSGKLELYSKNVVVGKRLRSRAFLRIGEAIEDNSVAEKIILSLFKSGEELRLYELRKRLEAETDVKTFKSYYVYEDVKAKGFCMLQYFTTSAGRRERKICANLIDETERDVNAIAENADRKKSRLGELGTNTVLLEDRVQKRLGIYRKEFPELELMFGVGAEAAVEAGGYTIGGTGYGVGGFGGGYSGGGFSGFGGGSFGGGGAGGSW